MRLIPGFSLHTRKFSTRHGAQAHAPIDSMGRRNHCASRLAQTKLLSAGLLAALLSPDAAPASRGATGLGEQPGCTPHPVLMQGREWLRPCSMPTPRFRQSIERYRSQFVNVRSCKAGQVKVRLARAAVDETRSKARERHLSASHLREEGHAESSYPPLLHRRSPSLLHPR
jgi:hypothetical protein